MEGPNAALDLNIAADQVGGDLVAFVEDNGIDCGEKRTLQLERSAVTMRAMHWQSLMNLVVPLALFGCSRSPEHYSAACATPPSNWGTEKDGIGHLLPVMSIFVTTDGTVLWNKAAISNEKLGSDMHEASGRNPVPQIVLEVSPAAPCQRVREVRSIMDQSPMCKGSNSRCSEGWNPKEWPMFGGP